MNESMLDEKDAVYSEVVKAGDYWVHSIRKGQVLRIVDMEGNQAADTLFYDAHDPLNRYSASDTIVAQKRLYLTKGTKLMSVRGDELLEIVGDTCGRHDTLGGACSRESNTMRYCHSKEHMHACRDSFIQAVQAWNPAMDKRDITCNINFFMNVPVTPDGRLTFEDGISAPGRYVEMQALRDVVCVVSNCPQLNNPCNAYNPTPVKMVIWGQ